MPVSSCLLSEAEPKQGRSDWALKTWGRPHRAGPGWDLPFSCMRLDHRPAGVVLPTMLELPGWRTWSPESLRGCWLLLLAGPMGTGKGQVPFSIIMCKLKRQGQGPPCTQGEALCVRGHPCC